MKLVAAERSLLKKLVGGAMLLIHSGQGNEPIVILRAFGAAGPETVINPRTVDRLVAKKYLEFIGAGFVITPAGREAVRSK